MTPKSVCAPNEPYTRWTLFILHFWLVPSGNKDIYPICKYNGSAYALEVNINDRALPLTLSWRRPILYRNQSIDLRSKSMDWFLYDIGLRHERVKWRHPDVSRETVIWRCSSKYVFLKISQISQKNTCVGVYF